MTQRELDFVQAVMKVAYQEDDLELFQALRAFIGNDAVYGDVLLTYMKEHDATYSLGEYNINILLNLINK